MLYLTTGGNGAGKTLLTLRDVRAKGIAENRPVYHNGRFKPVEGGELSSWKQIDIKDWQSIPDGAIFLVDECHNDFPVRSTRDALPEYVRMLAEHRSRGFDFFLITQHPLNMDSFVRRLISAPGWHRHLKRASGAPLVSVLTWPAVNDKCEKNGAGTSASTEMVRYPREVFDWYESTSLNTAKIKIPFQAKMLLASVLLVPLLGWYGYKTMNQRFAPKETVSAAPVAAPELGATAAKPQAVQTPEQYAESFEPRVAGLAYTAPRYDELTKPSNVPYPAACIQMGKRCECYTQQATKLPVPLALCSDIVKGGYFNDWQGALQQASAGTPPKATSAPIQTSMALNF
jgi:zona occludens toxin